MRITLSILCAVALVLTAASCNPKSPKQSYEESQRAEDKGAPVAGSGSATHEADIGDVETSLVYKAVLPEDFEVPNVAIEELINMKKGLDMVTATIQPPPPAELWVNFIVESKVSFEKFPVVFRSEVTRNNEPVASYSVVLGPEANKEPHTFRFNAFEGLTDLPGKIVLHAHADVIMLPNGTDPVTVDPATVAGTPKTTGAALSNPFVIRIEQGETVP
ncbi:MAG: hypothetical protein GWP08_21425 [Nitrospiraceae bacterium]|nr:hypothetical protein [Nitrospiraceae bacterium]